MSRFRTYRLISDEDREKHGSANEWEVDRLDLDAYLARTGHAGSLDPTGTTLAALHRAHIDAIPFENLDLILGRGVALDVDSLQAKLVTRRRGGYCHEHGLLFGAVLERLGYRVDRLLARIGDDDVNPRPRTHLTLHVHNDEESWLADVGFGAGPRGPMPWHQRTPMRQGGWSYRLLSGTSGHWKLQEQRPDGWATLYSFTHERQHAADIMMANHFTSTHPSSPFVERPVVMRRDTHTRRRLRGRQLDITRSDGSTTERHLTDSELAATLHDDFGVHLGRDEVIKAFAGEF